MKKTWLIPVCLSGLVFGSLVAGWLAPDPVPQAAVTPTKAPLSQEQTILADTRLVVRYSFGGCGHFELKEEPLPNSWIGKRAGEVLLPGTLFDSFEQNTVYLAKISQKKCDRHFVVTARENRLEVTYQNDPSRVRDRYDFEPRFLSQQELDRLHSGVFLESEEELTRFIEDYCS